MTDLAGQTIGKYQILERLGQGGMAEVYKGFHPGLQRNVAIKILHSYLAEAQDFVGRFQREARAIAALRHPNIVQVFDFDCENDAYYMVMEFIDGPTLKSRVQDLQNRGESLPSAEVVRIFRALGSAIDYAHSRGVVHRDIKPANIMFDHEGNVYLTDFGIAYIVGGSRYTVTGGITGTPTYMAPEQGLGSAGDERSDIYSLGVILYEILTGAVPFDAPTPIGIIMKHVNEPLPRPSLVRPDLAKRPAVEQVILRALSKEPQDRFATASALARALEVAFVSGDATLIERPAEPAPLSARPNWTQSDGPVTPPPDSCSPTDQPTIVSRRRGAWASLPMMAGVGVLVCIVALFALFVVYPRTAHAPTIVIPTVVDADDLKPEGTAVALAGTPPAEATPEARTTADSGHLVAPSAPVVTPAAATASPTPKRTPLPLIVPTDRALAVAQPVRSGLITRFDDLVDWKRVRQVNGTLTQSTSPVHDNASFSAQLSYQFAPGSDFVVFEKAYPLEGRPTQISAWVYGDGSGVFLNCWISDVDQEVWQFSFGQVTHTGWREMTANLNPNSASGDSRQVSGDISATMDYPIDFQALVLDHAPDSSAGSGKIYLGEMTAIEMPSSVQPTGTSPLTPTVAVATPAIATVQPTPAMETEPPPTVASTLAAPAVATVQPTPAVPTETSPLVTATVTAPAATLASARASESENATPSPPAGHLAFVVFKPGMTKATYDLYVSNVDGTERRLVWEWARQPRFRRSDGRLIFDGDGQGKDNLWAVNLDGSDAREMSVHPEDGHPNWSPSGDRVLFDSEFYTWGATAARRIWTIWTNDTAEKGIEPKSVQVAGRVIAGRSPVWLQNDWIVYTGCDFWAGGGSCGLYTSPSWGADTARQLTTDPEDTAADSFGDRIVYASHTDGNWEVYAINFDGSGRANLTANPANDGMPTFSPDGRYVAFVSDRGGAWALWMMNPDGSAQTRLFDLPGSLGPDWTGERISWGP